MADEPYALLGVAKNATPEDISKAFRKLAKELHPDLNPGNKASAERFQKVSAAYELLSDDTRRRAHDEKRQKHLLDDPVAVARRMFESYLEDIE